jgi:hypothetical protein
MMAAKAYPHQTSCIMFKTILRAAIASLIFAIMAGCQAAPDDSRGPELTVAMSAVKGECQIHSANMTCNEVPAYLRDTLKLPSDTFISVSAQDNTPLDTMPPLIDALKAAGFTSVMGEIPLPPRR